MDAHSLLTFKSQCPFQGKIARRYISLVTFHTARRPYDNKVLQFWHGHASTASNANGKHNIKLINGLGLSYCQRHIK